MSDPVLIQSVESPVIGRPVPVLHVEFPEPWSIIAAARPAVAAVAKCAGKMKWSSFLDAARKYYQR